MGNFTTRIWSNSHIFGLLNDPRIFSPSKVPRWNFETFIFRGATNMMGKHAWTVYHPNYLSLPSWVLIIFVLIPLVTKAVTKHATDKNFPKKTDLEGGFFVHFTTVDGSEIPQTHQLRLVVCPIIYDGFLYIQNRWLALGFRPSTTYDLLHWPWKLDIFEPMELPWRWMNGSDDWIHPFRSGWIFRWTMLHPWKLTANAPGNWWLQDTTFLLGVGLFSGAMCVLGSVILQGVQPQQQLLLLMAEILYHLRSIKQTPWEKSIGWVQFWTLNWCRDFFHQQLVGGWTNRFEKYYIVKLDHFTM